MKPSFCWRSLAIGKIALVSSSRTAFPVLDVVVDACPELNRRDEVQLLRRKPVVRRQHSVDLVEDGFYYPRSDLARGQETRAGPRCNYFPIL